MHIDEELLERVMKTYDCESKTAAIHFALNELDRKARLKVFAREGLGFTPAELRAAVDPDYDVMALRVAETPVKYGKHRPRR
ncbi:MAG TPA: type II toxin-antitoxin system VapB family antitoxin [Chthoniobacteraceae bacterium]|nr:type II toxin-antitoxin system VapB family antitoxin [Chthoniobacteraceae bacterium]